MGSFRYKGVFEGSMDRIYLHCIAAHHIASLPVVVSDSEEWLLIGWTEGRPWTRASA